MNRNRIISGMLAAGIVLGFNFDALAQAQGGFARRPTVRTTVYDPFFERVPGALPLLAYILSTPVPPATVLVSGIPGNFARANLGTYWTLVRPPAPLLYNPYPEAPVYLLDATNRVWIIDDRGVDYALIDQLQAEQARQAAEETALLRRLFGESAESESGESTPQHGLEELWLEIHGSPTNAAAFLTLHNTVAAGTYEIWAKTNLTD